MFYWFGAVLAQVDDDQNEYVVQYASRAVSNKMECKAPITELEARALVWGIKKFRRYLYQQPFTVVTDHRALLWIFGESGTSKDNQTLIKLSLQLVPYAFFMHIRFRKGEDNVNADTLSHLHEWIDLDSFTNMDRDKLLQLHSVINAIVQDDTLEFQEHWRKAIAADKRYGSVYNYLTKNVLPVDRSIADRVLIIANDYEVVDGVLFKKLRSSDKTQAMEMRVVVPLVLTHEVLHDCHNIPSSAHFGIHHTYSRVASHYFWHGLYQDVRNWCLSCIECQQRKGHLHELGLPQSFRSSGFMQVLGADFLGPLPVTRKGNRYILVFTDLWSKFVEVFAVPQCDAVTVANIFYHEIVCRMGAPQALLTDRGKAFIGEVMKRIKKLLGTATLRTSGYHPQTNGQTERFNQTFIGSFYYGE